MIPSEKSDQILPRADIGNPHLLPRIDTLFDTALSNFKITLITDLASNAMMSLPVVFRTCNWLITIIVHGCRLLSVKVIMYVTTNIAVRWRWQRWGQPNPAVDYYITSTLLQKTDIISTSDSMLFITTDEFPEQQISWYNSITVLFLPSHKKENVHKIHEPMFIHVLAAHIRAINTKHSAYWFILNITVNVGWSFQNQ